MRHHNLQVTGSVSVNGIFAATAADLAIYTGSNDTKVSTLQSFTASVSTTNTFTASANSRLDSIETFTASVNTTNTFTASATLRLNDLETKSASVDTLNTSQNTRLTNLEDTTGSLATTGSNTFYGTQTFSGSVYIKENLIVQGSSSLQNITASAVDIGTNKIILNVDNPSVRYAGISVYDSGSTAGTGSLFWDSVENHWLYEHPSDSAAPYNSAILISGPKNEGNLGEELELVNNFIVKAVGGDHISSSAIYDDGSIVAIKNTTHITGSLNIGASSYPSVNLYTTSGTNFAITNRYTDNRLSIDKIGTGEIVNILGNGNIGIGITNPTYPLTRNGMTFKASGTDGAEFVMLSSTDTGFTGGVLTRNGLDFGFINRTSGSVIFATNATERMFITSAGKVGIGISNPTRQLDIVATGEQLRLSYDGSTTYTDFRNDSAGGLLVNTSAGYIIHYIASSLIMRMNANGQVGIGTNPSEKLDVNGNIRSTGTSTILRLDNTGGTPQSWWVGQDIAGTNDGIFYIYNTTSATHALTINKSNRVGIGIGSSTAYSPLTLKGSSISWGETMTIYPASSGYTTIALRLEGSDTTTGTWAIGKQSTQAEGGVEYLQFVKNGLTGGALHRADAVQTFNPSNGNALFGFKVGIGITNPGSSLSIGAVGTGTGTSSPVLVDLGSTYGTNAVGKNQKIKLWSSTNGDNYTYGIGVSSALLEITAATDASIGFYKNGTTPTELGRFTNSGAFTRPLQPAFLAYSTNSGFSVTGGSWYNISNALTEEEYDIGSNYSGGRFTAPVAGRYLFYAGGWSQIYSNGERYAWCVQKNGSGLTFISGANYCITDSPLSGHTIVYSLAAGDYVDLLAFSSVSGTWGPGTHRVYFGGYLL
jgi:hypothetical protein